jgi:hypothetical protein
MIMTHDVDAWEQLKHPTRSEYVFPEHAPMFIRHLLQVSRRVMVLLCG